MANGFIKLNRKLLDSFCFKDSELLHVWIYLLLDANHAEGKLPVGNNVVTVLPGQMVTSRKRISEGTGIQESKVERILTLLKTEQQIEQQSFSKYRIITIVNWDVYQNGEQQNEQQMNSKRTASEHIKEEIRITKKNKEKTLKPLPPESLRLSGLLADWILKNNPSHKDLSNGKFDKTVAMWAEDIDKMMRLDGRTESNIEMVINWCQVDSFWKVNILSGATLRKQYDKLILKATPQEDTRFKDW